MLPRYNDLIRMRPPSFIARALARLSVAGLVAARGGRRRRPDSRASAVRGRHRRRSRAGRAGRASRPSRICRGGSNGSSTPCRWTVDGLQLAAQHEPQAERRLFDELLAAGAGRRTARWRRRSTARRRHRSRGPGGRSSSPMPGLPGPEAAFLVPDAQGLRLVHVHPLSDPGSTAQRVGTLVLQAPLARAGPGDQGGEYTLPEAMVPVRVRPRFEGGGEQRARRVLDSIRPTARRWRRSACPTSRWTRRATRSGPAWRR